MSRLLIKNGEIVDSCKKEKKDILIEAGKIVKVESSISPAIDDKVIDASNLLVLPGLIDAHTHYGLVSRGTVTADSFPQGSKLAAFGGVTTIVDFSDHNKSTTLLASAESRIDEMKQGMSIDWALHQGVYGMKPDIKQQLIELKENGIKVIKIFTTYRNVGYLIEKREELSKLFSYCRELGLLVTAHCEFNDLIEELSNNWKGNFEPASHAELRPSEAEAKAIDYVGHLALENDMPLYIVHLSSEAGLDTVRKLRKEGAKIICETTPTYLFLEKSLLKTKNASLYIMTPPLRTKKDNLALQKALIDGEIQVVATDHCTFTYKQKMESNDCRYIYPGIPGTEELLPLLYTFFKEKNGIEKVVELISKNPAEQFGLYPNKGSLKVGTDADFVLFNPNKKWTLSQDTIHSASGYTAYQGYEVYGKVISTYIRGEALVDNGKYNLLTNYGKFIKEGNILAYD